MKWYELNHLGPRHLLEGAALHHRSEQEHKGRLLAHLAEIDAQKLYLPAAYSSMHAWCTGALGMSPDRATRCIQAARTARRLPADVRRGARRPLEPERGLRAGAAPDVDNASELVAAAARKSVRRSATCSSAASRRHCSWLGAPTAAAWETTHTLCDVAHCVRRSQVRFRSLQTSGTCDGCMRARRLSKSLLVKLENNATSQVAAPTERREPLPHRTRVELWLDDDAMADLQAALELDSHNVGPREHSKLVARALKAYRLLLAKRRCAETSQPRESRRASKSARLVPADVKREVWRRDGGRCTFTSDAGHRCEARSRLELDHVQPVARGGESTVENLRLRCRAHNQFTAEQAVRPRVHGGEASVRTRSAGKQPGNARERPARRELRPDRRRYHSRARDGRGEQAASAARHTRTRRPRSRRAVPPPTAPAPTRYAATASPSANASTWLASRARSRSSESNVLAVVLVAQVEHADEPLAVHERQRDERVRVVVVQRPSAGTGARSSRSRTNTGCRCVRDPARDARAPSARARARRAPGRARGAPRCAGRPARRPPA